MPSYSCSIFQQAKQKTSKVCFLKDLLTKRLMIRVKKSSQYKESYFYLVLALYTLQTLRTHPQEKNINVDMTKNYHLI